MRSEKSVTLEQLESTLGESLRALPSPTQTEALSKRLADLLLPGRAQSAGSPGGRRHTQTWRWPRLGMVAAALLVVVIASWGFGVWQDGSSVAGLGPLWVHSAWGASDQLSFRTGDDRLRLVTWEQTGTFPALPETMPVQQLLRPSLGTEDALRLAERMGISNGKLFPGEQLVTVRGEEVPVDEGVEADELHLNLRLGTWYYSARGHAAETAVGIDAAQAEQKALSWLQTVAVLPADYQVECVPDEWGSFRVSVRLGAGPDGLPVIGRLPSFQLTVDRGGRVTAAEGGWYEAAGSLTLPIISYADALVALQRGEGEFQSAAWQPLDAGHAKVEQASLAYQVAYALDYTPYLVPVAVFSGQYSARGETADFTAYVSLLASEEKPNAGNYLLQAELPAARATAAAIQERPLSASQAEIPALNSFFDANGASDSGYPAATSWNHGWMWRGSWQSGQQFSGRLNEQQAVAVALELSGQLPSLPGTLGEPEVLPSIAPETPGLSDEYCSVLFGLCYDGLPAGGLDGNGSRSYLSVQVQLTDIADKGDLGAVTMVHLALPMQLGEAMQLITPEQAWQKLLRNDAVIFLEDQLAGLPAARFQVIASSITAVQLTYVPRHRELARNEQWDLQYVFSGTAKVGDCELGFHALVNAVR